MSTKRRRVIVVDDEAVMRQSLEMTLDRAGYDVAAFESARDALADLASGGADALITDMRMPGIDGHEVLKRTRELSDEVPVIVITGYGSVASAVDAMKGGAFDYIEKPFEPQRIEVTVARAIESCAKAREIERLKAQLEDREAPQLIIGVSRSMREVDQAIDNVAASDATVLVTGESGTGKELIAREIHRRSARREAPFLAVNCAALSAGLLESELFGHERGAFTGADRSRKGRFELADGGTILLDEVSEVDPAIQAKLLRVLQEKAFERVGSSYARKVDVRIVATTNRDLPRAITAGRFRQDLFFRLNVLPISAPPLREHKEDLAQLVDYLLETATRRGTHKKPLIPPGTMALFEAYDWPGNVRELANVLERAIVMVKSAEIAPEMLRDWLSAPAAGSGDANPFLGMTLAELELKALDANMKKFGGNRGQVAKALGMADRTLRDKLKKMQDDRSESAE
ncbi:MAG: sigma-54 dependent transcriptional regulator [Planctomycetota bacterium]|nr:sigma-54 dependent transcriptional regulator [Planctomycetota bacterium]